MWVDSTAALMAVHWADSRAELKVGWWAVQMAASLVASKAGKLVDCSGAH